MQTLADLLQPFFAARVQGKEATRQARDSLNREEFDRKVQFYREQQAEERRKREGNLKIGLDLIGSGYDPKTAFSQQWMNNPQLLAGLPNMAPDRDKFMASYGGSLSAFEKALADSGMDMKTLSATVAKRISDEKESADRWREVQAKLASDASTSGNDLKKFQLDTIAKSQFAANPVMQKKMEELAVERAKRVMYRANIDALKNSVTGIDADAVKQYTDSLLNAERNIGLLRSDSTNVMDLLRAQALGQLPTEDFSDEELENYWIGQ